eukprot:ctg_762.g377
MIATEHPARLRSVFKRIHDTINTHGDVSRLLCLRAHAVSGCRRRPNHTLCPLARFPYWLPIRHTRRNAAFRPQEARACVRACVCVCVTGDFGIGCAAVRHSVERTPSFRPGRDCSRSTRPSAHLRRGRMSRDITGPRLDAERSEMATGPTVSGTRSMGAPPETSAISRRPHRPVGVTDAALRTVTAQLAGVHVHERRHSGSDVESDGRQTRYPVERSLRPPMSETLERLRKKRAQIAARSAAVASAPSFEDAWGIDDEYLGAQALRFRELVAEVAYPNAAAEYERRAKLAKHLQRVADSRFRGCQARVYGSTATGVLLRGGDLDINFVAPMPPLEVLRAERHDERYSEDDFRRDVVGDLGAGAAGQVSRPSQRHRSGRAGEQLVRGAQHRTAASVCAFRPAGAPAGDLCETMGGGARPERAVRRHAQQLLVSDTADSVSAAGHATRAAVLAAVGAASGGDDCPWPGSGCRDVYIGVELGGAGGIPAVGGDRG